MPAFDDADVSVIVADYIGVDPFNKLNMIGAGFALAGLQATGLTPPMFAAAMVDLPMSYVGQDFAILLELRNESTGSVVTITGAGGQPDAVRAQQVIRLEQPQAFPGWYLSEDAFIRKQIVLAFPMGLPLTPAARYRWRVEIDGQGRDDWGTSFFVPGPPPPVVLGGNPARPTDLPGLPPLQG